MLFLIIAHVLSAEECTHTSNMITIEDDTSLSSLKDAYRPIYLRLTSPGCPYSQQSDAQWQKAASLFPQVNFVTVNCWENSAICSLFGDSISTPQHGLVMADSTTVVTATIFGNPSSIHESPQLFVETIQNYAHLYPVTSPLYILTPVVTDSFYRNVENPIFAMYDSRCSEHVTFVNAWSKAANEDLFPEGDNPRIGLLDCSVYPDECKRWSSPYQVSTPRALIYSSKTGNFEVLDSVNSLTKEKINTLVSNADYMKYKETPTPVPNPSIETNEPSTEGYTILVNNELEKRNLNDIKSEYLTVFSNIRSGCQTQSDCDTRSRTEEKCAAIENSAEDHTKAVSILNFFRKLAGFSGIVVEDNDWSSKAYQAAINMHEIRRVPSNHEINPIYANDQYCGKTENIQVARDSLLSENSPSASHSMYKLMQDEGNHNNGVVGHRRYLLHPNLNKIGIGFYPYKEKHLSGNMYAQKPAVVVHKIIDNNNLKYLQNSVPSNLNFISWPPAGPFPIDQLPSNWHICHPSFETATLDDLIIIVKRDDNMELKVEKAYLSNNNYIDNSLIIQMSSEALKRCQAMRTITVSVYNTKSKQLFKFSFELFDNNQITEVCFYSTDINSCPSTITESNKFGPNNYNNNIFSSSTNPVKIYVSEPITLSQSLLISAPYKFFFVGNSIIGRIEIQKNSIVDIQDPTKTDFTLHWSISTKKIGKIETSKEAKSIYIQVSDETDKLSLYDLEFYTGRQTSCELSVPVYKGNEKYIYYSIGGSDDHYFVQASSTDAYEIYSTVDDSSINSDPKVHQIFSIHNLKDQKTFKRAVKVYFNKNKDDIDEINMNSFIPGQKRDYQFINLGSKTSLYCDLDIEKVASKITFSQKDNREYDFLIVSPDPTDKRYTCSLTNVYVKGMKYNNLASSTTVMLPYVLGDNTAISFFTSDKFHELYPRDEDKGKDVIRVGRLNSNSPLKGIVITDGKYDHYTIAVDDYRANYGVLMFIPEPGTESKPITIKFIDSFQPNNQYPNTENHYPFYFSNYENLQLDIPLFLKNNNQPVLAKLYNFENCGDVKFIHPLPENLPEISFQLPYPNVDYGFSYKVNKLPEKSSVNLINAIVSDLNLLGKDDSTLKRTQITGNEIKVGSSTIVLDNCQVKENIQISLTKENEGWPRLALVNTPIKPSKIKIDLQLQNNKLNLLEAEYEKHSVITGISSTDGSNCDQILATVELINNNDFIKKCSGDKTEIHIVKGEENAPVLTPSDGSQNPPEEITTESPSDDGNGPKENISKGLSAGQKAGIAVGVIAGVAIIAVVIFFVVKKMRNKKVESSDFQEPNDENDQIET